MDFGAEVWDLGFGDLLNWGYSPSDEKIKNVGWDWNFGLGFQVLVWGLEFGVWGLGFRV